MDLLIRPFKPKDYPEVAKIYQAGIDTQIATFETEAPVFEAWDLRFCKACRLVAEVDHKIAGWAALSLVSKREVYRGVAEVTVYVAPQHQNKRIGLHLLKALIQASEQAGFWTLTAHIFPQNKASIHVHQKLGFKLLGIHEKIAQRNGKWQDNALLERRSTKIL